MDSHEAECPFSGHSQVIGDEKVVMLVGNCVSVNGANISDQGRFAIW